MKRSIAIFFSLLLLALQCRSYNVRKLEVLHTTKEGKIIYTADAMEQRYLLLEYPVDSLICVANNEGDLICR